MKKIIIFAAVALCVVLAAVVVFNYFSIPEHVRRGESDNGSDTISAVSMIDDRIKEALEAEKEYIMEDIGLDIPYSADLLKLLEDHFGTDMEFLGAGVYRGNISEDILIELLLNPKGKVGQVQVVATGGATDENIKAAIAAYARFVNTTLDESTVEAVVTEALPELQNLKAGESYTYFNHNVGFAGKSENGQLIIYIP